MTHTPHFLSLAVLVALACSASLCTAQKSHRVKCPNGKAFDPKKLACRTCAKGTVKWPVKDGALPSRCVSASRACGSAEKAVDGVCERCPFDQVAINDRGGCGACAFNYVKVPLGVVKDAQCQRTNETVCTTPTPERCDNFDNDCDGQVDNGLPPIVCAPCNKTIPACAGGLDNTCLGVCACCKDCPTAAENVEQAARCKAVCLEECIAPQCGAYDGEIVMLVTDSICERAIMTCGIVGACPSGDCDPLDSAWLNEKACFSDATVDKCIEDGRAFYSTDVEGACSLLSPNMDAGLGQGTRGTCKTEELQKLVDAELVKRCEAIGKGAVFGVPF